MWNGYCKVTGTKFIAQVLNELGMGLVGAKLVPVTNGNRMTWHLSDCPT